MSLKLIDEWRDAWKWLSVHASLLVVAWGLTPPDQQAVLLKMVGINPDLTSYVPALLGFIVIYARLVRQGAPAAAGEADPP